MSYRVPIDPQTGPEVFTLQTIPPQPEPGSCSSRVAKLNGFSLHEGVAAKAHQRNNLKRFCRYTIRPAVAEKRLIFCGSDYRVSAGLTTFGAGDVTGTAAHVIICLELNYRKPA